MRIRLFTWGCSIGLVVSVSPVNLAQAQFSFGFGTSGNRPDQTQPRGSGNDGPTEGKDSGNTPTRSWPSFLDNFEFMTRPSAPRPKDLSPRDTFEQRFAAASPEEAVHEFETLQLTEFSQYLKMPLTTVPPTAAQISQQLTQIATETGKHPAVVYAVALKQQTHVLLVLPGNSTLGQSTPFQKVASRQFTPGLLAQNATPPVIRQVLPEVSRETVLAAAKTFRKAVSNPTDLNSTNYLEASQQLYRWIVAPLEPQLRSQGIDTLLFAMDDGLRTIPLQALHNGSQYLVEQYSSALIPSFGLTNTNRSLALKQQPILAMGISKSTDGLAPLPAVPTEISTITRQIWAGPSQNTLDEDSTLDRLKQLYQQQRFGVLHLATHAVFDSGEADRSYIQFWNNKLTLPNIRQLSAELRWNQLPSLELLVLSACQTALGSKEAELGFAGTAINAGVPAAIASLWSIDDQGTLGLMTGFYDQLQTSLTKADALRQAQLRMLRGEVRLQNGQLSWPNQSPIEVMNGEGRSPNRLFTHPYFWSGYTVVGNWN